MSPLPIRYATIYLCFVRLLDMIFDFWVCQSIGVCDISEETSAPSLMIYGCSFVCFDAFVSELLKPGDLAVWLNLLILQWQRELNLLSETWPVAAYAETEFSMNFRPNYRVTSTDGQTDRVQCIMRSAMGAHNNKDARLWNQHDNMLPFD